MLWNKAQKILYIEILIKSLHNCLLNLNNVKNDNYTEHGFYRWRYEDIGIKSQKAN